MKKKPKTYSEAVLEHYDKQAWINQQKSYAEMCLTPEEAEAQVKSILKYAKELQDAMPTNKNKENK